MLPSLADLSYANRKLVYQFVPLYSYEITFKRPESITLLVSKSYTSEEEELSRQT